MLTATRHCGDDANVLSTVRNGLMLVSRNDHTKIDLDNARLIPTEDLARVGTLHLIARHRETSLRIPSEKSKLWCMRRTRWGLRTARYVLSPAEMGRNWRRSSRKSESNSESRRPIACCRSSIGTLKNTFQNFTKHIRIIVNIRFVENSL